MCRNISLGDLACEITCLLLGHRVYFKEVSILPKVLQRMQSEAACQVEVASRGSDKGPWALNGSYQIPSLLSWLAVIAF